MKPDMYRTNGELRGEMKMGEVRRGRWMVGDMAMVHLALLTVQVGYGGYYVLTKAAMSGGVNLFVFAIYRDVIGLTLLSPYAFLSERDKRPPLTLPICLLIMTLGVTGIFLQQTLFLAGLNYTNTSFAASMQNAIPVFTFMIAALFRLEEIRYRHLDGIAKILGVITCVGGATLMSLYKGPVVLGMESVPLDAENYTAHTVNGRFTSALLGIGLTHWQIGAIFLVANCLCMGIYTNLQVPTLRRFPAPFSLTACSIFIGTIALGITGVFSVSKKSEWILSSIPNLVSAVYAGAIASGLNFSLQAWSNQRGGPVLLAAYIPLQTVFAVVLGLLILGDSLFLGSLVGAILILGGLYMVIWGQRKHRQARDLESKNRPSFCNGASIDIDNDNDHTYALLPPCPDNS